MTHVALEWACSGAGIQPRVLRKVRLQAPSSAWAAGLAQPRFSPGVTSPQSLAFCTLVGCCGAKGGCLRAAVLVLAMQMISAAVSKLFPEASR